MAASWLLDSNILIAAIKGEPRALLNRLARVAPNRLFLSSIVLAELGTGAEKSRDRARRKADIEDLTQGMSGLPFEAADAAVYARIRAMLENAGTSIGPMDLLIAAQAVARELILVTDNVREFRRVPGLRCENWMR